MAYVHHPMPGLRPYAPTKPDVRKLRELAEAVWTAPAFTLSLEERNALLARVGQLVAEALKVADAIEKG